MNGGGFKGEGRWEGGRGEKERAFDIIQISIVRGSFFLGVWERTESSISWPLG